MFLLYTNILKILINFTPLIFLLLQYRGYFFYISITFKIKEHNFVCICI
jgi:hypothetical protein